MTLKQKNSLVLLITLLLAGLVYAWYYPLNQGAIEITTNTENSLIRIENTTQECPQSPCKVSFKTGKTSVIVSKAKYTSYSEPIEVKRFQTLKINALLEPIKELKVSAVVPKPETLGETKKIPQGLDYDLNLTPAWDADGGKLAYLDIKESRLSYVTNRGEKRIITPFYALKTPLKLIWSQDGQRLAAWGGKDVYLIDIKAGSKKKLSFSSEVISVKWDPASARLFIQLDTGRLSVIHANDLTVVPLEASFQLENSRWINEKTLLIYQEAQGETTLMTFDVDAKASSVLVGPVRQRFNEMKYDAGSKTAYFFSTDENRWYLLMF